MMKVRSALALQHFSGTEDYPPISETIDRIMVFLYNENILTP